ncbi:unnamed protein product [Prunus brigantina]
MASMSHAPFNELMPLTIAANPLIANHQTRALIAFPQPRAQNPRSERWLRFTGIYGGHTTMLHDPKCRFDYPLAPIRLHHADLFSLDYRAGTPAHNCTASKRRTSHVNAHPLSPEHQATEHAVRISASDPITTDRTAESMQEQAVVEDLMDKQAYRIETSFMAAMDRFSSELRTLFQEKMSVTSSATPP